MLDFSFSQFYKYSYFKMAILKEYLCRPNRSKQNFVLAVIKYRISSEHVSPFPQATL